jgi:hypothetical protein
MGVDKSRIHKLMHAFVNSSIESFKTYVSYKLLFLTFSNF